MNIITQLEQTVTPAVLGAGGGVAQASLLEQFYAILITRLSTPEIYTQLQRDDQSLLQPTAAQNILFEQIWLQPSQRHLLIQELATTHHLDEITTEQLLINATQLAYREMKTLANGQFLPAFLQAQQPSVRHYLPVWAAAVVSTEVAVVAGGEVVDKIATTTAILEKKVLAEDALIYRNDQSPKAAIATKHVLADDALPMIAQSVDGQAAMVTEIDSLNAIHANPSDYRTTDGNSSVDRIEIRQRNQRSDLMIRLLLLAAALTTAFLLWLFVIKSDDPDPIVPVAAAPVVTPPTDVPPPAQPLIPAQLTVSVDFNGNLYSCSATVGDIALQNMLRQALTTSFGDQSNVCQFTVQEGVATTLSNVNVDTLPNVLMLMRAAPFSRLQLQNDSVSLEAPDEALLQRLLVDVRGLLPTMAITTATTVANSQPPANTYDDTYNNGSYNNGTATYNAGAAANNGSAPITNTNNVITNQPSPSGLNNNNPRTDAVPPPPPPQSSLNTNPNNSSLNSNSPNSNSMPQTNSSSGQISLAELDTMANTTIGSEPATGANPAN